MKFRPENAVSHLFCVCYRGTEAFVKMEKKKKKKKKEHTRPQIFMLSDESLRRVA